MKGNQIQLYCCLIFMLFITGCTYNNCYYKYATDKEETETFVMRENCIDYCKNKEGNWKHKTNLNLRRGYYECTCFTCEEQ